MIRPLKVLAAQTVSHNTDISHIAQDLQDFIKYTKQYNILISEMLDDEEPRLWTEERTFVKTFIEKFYRFYCGTEFVYDVKFCRSLLNVLDTAFSWQVVTERIKMIDIACNFRSNYMCLILNPKIEEVNYEHILREVKSACKEISSTIREHVYYSEPNSQDEFYRYNSYDSIKWLIVNIYNPNNLKLELNTGKGERINYYLGVFYMIEDYDDFEFFKIFYNDYKEYFNELLSPKLLLWSHSCGRKLDKDKILEVLFGPINQDYSSAINDGRHGRGGEDYCRIDYIETFYNLDLLYVDGAKKILDNEIFSPDGYWHTVPYIEMLYERIRPNVLAELVILLFGEDNILKNIINAGYFNIGKFMHEQGYRIN